MINPWRSRRLHWFYSFVEHGMTPEIIRSFYKYMDSAGCKIVVDPFVGGGVVAVEGVLRGFNVIGIDANPWALTVTIAKTYKPLGLEKLPDTIRDLYGETDKIFIPSSRLEKYHPPDKLQQLGIIRALIEMVGDEYKPLLLTLFGRMVEEYSYFKRTPAPRFGGKPSKNDPFKRYMGLVEKAVDELLRTELRGSYTPVHSDSTEWLPDRICGLLTSPPFMNNIDYIRHTQLQLLWAGFARDSGDLGFLRSLQLPACTATGRWWKMEARSSLVEELIDSMSVRHRVRYARFMRQYVYYMGQHFKLLAEKLVGEAWYTIGDSYLGGVYVPAHRILEELASEQGLKTHLYRVGVRYSKSRRVGLYLLKITPRV